MDETDLYGLLTGDDATAQEKAQAMTAALRGQRQRADAQQQLGLLAQASGDRVLSPLGKSIVGVAQGGLERADTGQRQLAQVAETRLQRALQAQKDSQQKAFEEGELDLRRRALDQGQWTPFNGKDGEVLEVNHRTGQTRLLGQAPVGSGAARPLGAKDMERQWKDYADSVSTYRGRGNLNRDNQASLQRAEALEALLQVPDLNTINSSQVREASTSLAGLISRGGSQAVSQIEELTPHTLAGQFANIKQKLLNEPQGAEAKAFLQNMLETAQREKKVIREQIRRGQLQSLPNHLHLHEADPNRFENILSGAGLNWADLDPKTGLPKAAGGAGVGPATDRRARIQARMKELDPDGRMDPVELKKRLAAEFPSEVAQR